MARRNDVRNAALAEKAAAHVAEMEQKYAEQMRASAAESVIYGGPDRAPERAAARKAGKCRQVFRGTDSVSAAIWCAALEARSAKLAAESAAGRGAGSVAQGADSVAQGAGSVTQGAGSAERGVGSAAAQGAGKRKIAVLNFADYTRPGGLYLQGGNVQEESLCMESDLFGILRSEALSGYYEYNRKNRNNEIYTDRAIYTPGVVFARDGEEYRFDVITCAAPNKSAAGRYHRVKTEENHQAMQQRIRFLRDVAEDQNVDVLIAGAWGCGAFGQPPTLVAKWFDDTFWGSGVGKVVYAVPASYGENANVRAFRSTFA